MIASLLRRKDALSGVFFTGVGFTFLLLSRDYEIGTALDLGSGFFPRALAMLLAGWAAASHQVVRYPVRRSDPRRMAADLLRARRAVELLPHVFPAALIGVAFVAGRRYSDPH